VKKQFQVLLILFSFITFAAVAQQPKQKPSLPEYRDNSIYIESGGPGLTYSLGYETTFYHTRHFSAIANIGAGYLPVSGGISGIYFQPGALFHFGKSALESGIALSYLYQGSESDYPEEDGAHLTTLVPRIGYRYTFNQNKCFLRLGITPLIIIDANQRDNGFVFWANVATFGFRF